jgi:hypothetical protein
MSNRCGSFSDRCGSLQPIEKKQIVPVVVVKIVPVVVVAPNSLIRFTKSPSLWCRCGSPLVLPPLKGGIEPPPSALRSGLGGRAPRQEVWQ